MRNSPKQVFAGGWSKIASAVSTANILDGLVDIGGFFIKPDGTMLFLELTNTIQAYNLSVPWDIFSAGPIIASFPITDDSNAIGLSFSSDGTIMIVVGENTKILYSYVLPNPWDITSIVATPTTMSLAVMLSSVYNCAFSRDGDYVFVNDIVDIYSFPLPMAYDITSNVTNTSSTLGLAVFGGFTFKPEGNRMYVVDLFNETIHEFELSTINDITTATPTGNTLSIFLIIGGNTLISRPNGNEFFATSIGSGEIKKLSMTNSWDIPNASYFTNNESIPANDPRAITWKPDGMKFIIADNGNNTITEYTVTHPYNQTGATQGAIFSIQTTQTSVTGMYWDEDGMTCYIVGATQDRLNRLDLGVAWDVSTMSDPDIFFEIPNVGVPTGIFFNRTKTRFYITNNDTVDTLVQFDMTPPVTPSDPADIESAVFAGDFDFIRTNESPQDLVLSPDYTILLLIVNGPDKIIRYTLTIPGDITTAVFEDFRGTTGEGNAFGLFMRRYDGKKLYYVGNNADAVISLDVVA